MTKKPKRIHPIVARLGGALGGMCIRTWMSTLDFKVAYYDPTVDPVHEDYHGQKIYVFWHENILFPIYLRGHCNVAMLLSRHRDADILSEIADRLGFEFIRGSSYRGGAAAIRELLRRSAHMNLAITPDGPRGPRRTLAPGPVYLASKLQLPLVTMGFGYDRPWRMNTWDRFAMPRPFSRARAVIGPAMRLPAELDRDGIEHYRLETQRLLNRLTDEAEAWATSQTGKVGQQPLRRERPKCKKVIARLDPPHESTPGYHWGAVSAPTDVFAQRP